MTPDQIEYFVNFLASISEALISHREELDTLEKRIIQLEAKNDDTLSKSKDKRHHK